MQIFSEGFSLRNRLCRFLVYRLTAKNEETAKLVIFARTEHTKKPGSENISELPSLKEEEIHLLVKWTHL